MIKPFDGLYDAMERSLAELELEVDEANRYLKGIELCRKTFFEMRVLSKELPEDSQTEVEYFRLVWPWFYGKLLFYIRLHRFEQDRRAMPERALSTLMAREEQRVTSFFHINGEFWLYYQCEAAVLNEQFTRAYSCSRIFEPLALVIDQEAATLGSYRAAWCLAMAFYRAWLRRERVNMAPGGELSDYTWASSSNDYIEWINGLHAVGAINYKGQPADISRLAKWGKLVLGKVVTNMYDRFNVLSNRKKERIPFTKRIELELERKMDEKNGKFD